MVGQVADARIRVDVFTATGYSLKTEYRWEIARLAEDGHAPALGVHEHAGEGHGRAPRRALGRVRRRAAAERALLDKQVVDQNGARGRDIRHPELHDRNLATNIKLPMAEFLITELVIVW